MTYAESGFKCTWCERLVAKHLTACAVLPEDDLRRVYVIGDDDICKREIGREISKRMAEQAHSLPPLFELSS